MWKHRVVFWAMGKSKSSGVTASPRAIFSSAIQALSGVLTSLGHVGSILPFYPDGTSAPIDIKSNLSLLQGEALDKYFGRITQHTSGQGWKCLQCKIETSYEKLMEVKVEKVDVNGEKLAPVMNWQTENGVNLVVLESWNSSAGEIPLWVLLGSDRSDDPDHLKQEVIQRAKLRLDRNMDPSFFSIIYI